ncbi:32023_t:CDS:2, partial [Racocetra persica]
NSTEDRLIWKEMRDFNNFFKKGRKYFGGRISDVIHLYGCIYSVCCEGFWFGTYWTERLVCVSSFQDKKPAASFKRENDFMLSPNLYCSHVDWSKK